MSEADLVFTGGPVLCMDGARTRASALAVRGGRIAAIGRDVGDLVGPGTEVVELAGRPLLPGFQDAHVHAVLGGVELGQCDLTGTVDPDEYLRRIRAYADAHPGAEWIVGGGWSLESFAGGVPTADLLDAVVADRPVFLFNRDHHGAWVNSRALERAGVDRDTPDPADGVVNRDAHGRPTGCLQEGAVSLVAGVLPAVTPADRLAGLLRAQTLLHSLGITAWQDAMVGGSNGYPDVSDAYLTAARDGLLTADVVGALWWDRERGAEQIPDLVDTRARFTVGRLRCSTVKIMQDGIVENFTAAMTSPYKDARGDATANTGLSFVDPAALCEHVTALDALDFQVHFHALGDRAVREALDAVAAARAANGFRDTRPHLAHLQVVDPADVPRFRGLGASANLQALWATHEPQMDELTVPFLGDGLAARQYPFGDLFRAGATLAAGSDWPVSSPDPMAAIHVAVNRRLHGRTGAAFLPDQRVDLGTALAAYTAGSAYVNHRDDTGTLAVGRRADLVVLDRDPFDGPPEEIGAARAARTYVDGALVYA
ncbi:amidohydrolase [Virgisporangium aurantiacum]|uniref:Amidohydrolase n=1 Tax=Virgisporangium aurantiacum TaxID=175570 RepID=A0A8J3Z3F1_9ACTN|nr:amidohydrolase [Virgisporangium aurantiacum]GIJ56776.1 amidohydrolase [Virgisporangium aurantiacum]